MYIECTLITSPVNTACCLLLALSPLSPHCVFLFVWNVFSDFSNAVTTVVVEILSKIHFFFKSSKYSPNIFSPMVF